MKITAKQILAYTNSELFGNYKRYDPGRYGGGTVRSVMQSITMKLKLSSADRNKAAEIIKFFKQEAKTPTHVTKSSVEYDTIKQLLPLFKGDINSENKIKRIIISYTLYGKLKERGPITADGIANTQLNVESTIRKIVEDPEPIDKHTMRYADAAGNTYYLYYDWIDKRNKNNELIKIVYKYLLKKNKTVVTNFSSDVLSNVTKKIRDDFKKYALYSIKK